jgi:hypothetical protein
MLLSPKTQDDNPEYKSCHKRNFRSEQLTYEEAKNILEAFDENIRNQLEYNNTQLFEDLALDNEDIRDPKP